MFRRWRQPYAYIVLVEPIDENFDVVFGVFTSLDKAEQAITDWRLKEYDLHPHVLTLLTDYRTLTKPPKYWRQNDPGVTGDYLRASGGTGTGSTGRSRE